MRLMMFAAALLYASSALAQERMYNFQGYTLGEANVIARALEQGKLGETANVYFKMQRQITEQDQAAAQAARGAIEKDILTKIESGKPEAPKSETPQ